MLEPIQYPPAPDFDVVVVGAGLSGIAAGHYLQARCPSLSYVILESRQAIGGTWDLFRYPGVRSDSDMFTLGYSFRPWDSDSTFASGPTIRNYVIETARAEGIASKIRFGHCVDAADWDSERARWSLAVSTDSGGTAIRCRFVQARYSLRRMFSRIATYSISGVMMPRRA